MPPELAEVCRWLEKADHDRPTAEVAITLSRPITDTAAFHCQQAVEKVLKAYLVWREEPFEKIHDLEIITQSCARHDGSFSSLIVRVAPLTVYAVRFRYPGPNDPSVDEVNEALELVREVWNFVLERLPAEARPPSH